MAQQGREITNQSQDISRRQARAQRILDVASALILRWGYNKTTIDDIARQAGVAKGTIYLHWKTRDELFGALMRREKLEMAEDLKLRIMADPAGGTLRSILKHSALALMRRPLLKAALLNDIEVLGRLTRGEYSRTSSIEKLAGFTAYLEFLRERHLVRTDLDVRAQMYLFSAIFVGFFLVSPLIPDEFKISDDEMADLMAETAQRTLESGCAPAADDLQVASQVFMQYLNQAVVTAQKQFQQELEA